MQAKFTVEIPAPCYTMARLLGASLHMRHVDFTAHMVQKCGSGIQVHLSITPREFLVGIELTPTESMD